MSIPCLSLWPVIETRRDLGMLWDWEGQAEEERNDVHLKCDIFMHNAEEVVLLKECHNMCNTVVRSMQFNGHISDDSLSFQSFKTSVLSLPTLCALLFLVDLDLLTSLPLFRIQNLHLLNILLRPSKSIISLSHQH